MKKTIGIGLLVVMLAGFTSCSDPSLKEEIKIIKEDLAKTKDELSKVKADQEKYVKRALLNEKEREENAEGKVID